MGQISAKASFDLFSLRPVYLRTGAEPMMRRLYRCQNLYGKIPLKKSWIRVLILITTKI